MADPDSVMERSLEREGTLVLMRRFVEELNVELEAHMAEMDRRLSERLEALMNEPFAFLGSGSVGMGKSMRARRLSALFSAADGLEDLWLCGRLVYYDQIQPDFVDEGARIEYLKSLTQEEPPPQPPRRCPRPQRLERKGRDAERAAQSRRERRQQPSRAPKR